MFILYVHFFIFFIFYFCMFIFIPSSSWKGELFFWLADLFSRHWGVQEGRIVGDGGYVGGGTQPATGTNFLEGEGKIMCCWQ